MSCEQNHKELNRYRYSLYNMSGPNFLLSVTHVYLMRNRRSTLNKKKKFEKDLGYELNVFEGTGQWVDKGVKPVTIPPLFRKIEPATKMNDHLPVPIATKSSSERVRMVTGFLSVQEKNILRTVSG